MAAGSYLAFINVYLDDIGMSKFEIGLLSAIAPLAAMLLQPLFGMAADRARVKNTVAIVLCACWRLHRGSLWRSGHYCDSDADGSMDERPFGASVGI